MGHYGIDFPDNALPFMKVVERIVELHNKKAKDYGSADNPYANIEASERWGIPAWVGVTLRMGDKEQRIESFLLKGELANESIEDSLLDNAVYAILRVMEYERNSGSSNQTGPAPSPVGPPLPEKETVFDGIPKDWPQSLVSIVAHLRGWEVIPYGEWYTARRNIPPGQWKETVHFLTQKGHKFETHDGKTVYHVD